MLKRYAVLGRYAVLTPLLALALLGCDAAKADYDRCLELRGQDKLEEAAEACQAAVTKSPGTPAGAAAHKELGEIQLARISAMSEEVKKNTDCTKAQLDWIDAKPEEKARLASVRDQKCAGLLPPLAKPAPSAR